MGACHRSLTPVKHQHQATGCGHVAFRLTHDVGLHSCCISGLNHDSLHPRCLRFAAGVTPRPRKTRFWAAASLTQAGSTCGTPKEVSDSTCPPPPPGLAWRTGYRKIAVLPLGAGPSLGSLHAPRRTFADSDHLPRQTQCETGTHRERTSSPPCRPFLALLPGYPPIFVHQSSGCALIFPALHVALRGQFRAGERDCAGVLAAPGLLASLASLLGQLGLCDSPAIRAKNH